MTPIRDTVCSLGDPSPHASPATRSHRLAPRRHGQTAVGLLLALGLVAGCAELELELDSTSKTSGDVAEPVSEPESEPEPLSEPVVAPDSELGDDERDDYILLSTPTGTFWSRYWIDGDHVLIASDTAVGTVEEVFGSKGSKGPKGSPGDDAPAAVVVETGKLWPNGVVYYQIDKSGRDGFNPEGVAEIETALTLLEAATPFRFYEATSGSRIKIKRWDEPYGLSTSVGRRDNSNGQAIYLPGVPEDCGFLPDYGGTCASNGNRRHAGTNGMIFHELLHALGWFHTQQRVDRSDYVTYDRTCVQKKYRANFDVKWDNDIMGRYDVDSIMHYDGRTFCKKDDDDECICEGLRERGGAEIRPLIGRCTADAGVDCSMTSDDLQSIFRLYGQFNKDVAESNDQSGHSIAVGDFDGDGYDDMASGAIGENGFAGAVHVFKGIHGDARDTEDSWSTSEPGLVPWQILDQTGLDTNEAYDLFGWSMAAGDIDRDGFDDLAVSAILEDSRGAVYLFKGSKLGLEPWQALAVDGLKITRGGALFGYSLAIGDVTSMPDDQGRTYAEVVVGIPSDTSGLTSTNCGRVAVYGMNQDEVVVGKNQLALTGNACASGARTGESLALGYFTSSGSGKLQIAVGAPGFDNRAGRVYIVDASGDGWFHEIERTITQASTKDCRLVFYPPGSYPVESGDRFGASLATGAYDVAARGHTLAVGSPGEDSNTGLVHIFERRGTCFSREAIVEQPGAREANDQFGHALAFGEIDDDTFADLIVGTPGEGIGRDNVTAGWVYILRGGADDTFTPWTAVGQSTGPWGNESGEKFGHAVAVANPDRTRRTEVLVGSPGNRLGSAQSAGSVFLYHGNNTARPRAWRRLDQNTRSPAGK